MADGGATASAYWVVEQARGEIRESPLPRLPEKGCEIAVTCSGISPGTERLVGTGGVPDDLAERMACRYMEGRFSFPLKYGYATVGRVGAGEGRGERVFCMHPHQDRIRVDASHIVALPEYIPDHRACLLPNLETAWNAVMDGDLPAGEANPGVVGGGPVGTLVAFVLARNSGDRVPLFETDADRRKRISRLGWADSRDPDTAGDTDFTHLFHCSGTSQGLQFSIDHVGFEGTVIDLSWYGDRRVCLELGRSFHYDRKRIIASQVSTLAAPVRAAMSLAGRTELILELLVDRGLDAMIGPLVPFADLPGFMEKLYGGHTPGLCPVVTY